MGKRKSKAAKPQKRTFVIPKLFPCPLCHKNDGIKITIARRPGGKFEADLVCRKCGTESRNIRANALTAPIDVYSEWMDSERLLNEKYNTKVTELNDEQLDDLIREKEREARRCTNFDIGMSGGRRDQSDSDGDSDEDMTSGSD